MNVLFLSYLIVVFDRHVDGYQPQGVLKDLSCEVSLLLAGELVSQGSTYVKLWFDVIDVNDGDQYSCSGAGW